MINALAPAWGAVLSSQRPRSVPICRYIETLLAYIIAALDDLWYHILCNQAAIASDAQGMMAGRGLARHSKKPRAKEIWKTAAAILRGTLYNGRDALCS